MWSARCFYQILTKTGVPWKSSYKSPVSNFVGIRPVATALICADIWTNGYDRDNRHFPRLRERAWKEYNICKKWICFRPQWKRRGGTQAYCVFSVLKTLGGCPVTNNSACCGPNLKRHLAGLRTWGRKRIHFTKGRVHFLIWYDGQSTKARLKVKGKGKGYPITGHEDPEGEQMYSSTIPSASVLDGGGCSTPRPGRFTPGKDPVPIVQEAGWAPGPVWTGAEDLTPLGFDPLPV